MTTDFGATGGTELVLVSAADDAALAAEAARIVAYIDRVPDAPLADIAYTCSLSHGDAVLALVVSSVHDLRARLASARDRIYGVLTTENYQIVFVLIHQFLLFPQFLKDKNN